MWMFRLRKFLKTAGREALILLMAFRHPGTPGIVKLGTLLLLVYAVSPIDLIPDFPGLGWLDDAAILMLVIPALVRRLPDHVARQTASHADRWLARFGFGGSRGTPNT